jgi:light-regulated signal transduction histidine kinase (bacteriophytochrome)
MDLELDMVSNMLKVSIKQKQNIFSSYDIEKITGILSENNKSSSGENDALELEMMLTKRFVELHDGSIWFESCGEGSCFSFILPADTKVENESQLILV